MNRTQTQKKITDKIEEELQALQLPGQPSSLYNPVRYTLSLGGKRIRPYFTLIGCGLCGEDIQKAIPAALSIELLHNFTLLHDDIMDDAEIRRGQPSVFSKWGTSTAILSGDAMYAWAFEQLRHYGKDDFYNKEQYALIIELFLQSAKTVCEGQAYDLEFENKPHVTVQEYLEMIEGKTAALISGAFKLGGAVAAAPKDSMEALDKIGTEIGVAFQIQDDLLDAIADPEKFGKTRGGDIIEGKKTYLSILALEKSSSDDKEILERVFGGGKVGKQEVKKVISIYNSLGIIDIAVEEIKKRYDKALDAISAFDDSPYKKDLKQFLRKIINREY